MNAKKIILVFVGIFVVISSLVLPSVFSQTDLGSVSLSVPSVKDKVHALELTRFHFITLKQFHSGLFSLNEDKKTLSDSEAQILNAGLNAFLNSVGRETMLLEALRQDRAVQLRFQVPQSENTYKMIDHPTKPLVYHLESANRSLAAAVEIKPFLDKPVAFEITLRQGKGKHRYQVDWAGQIARMF